MPSLSVKLFHDSTQVFPSNTATIFEGNTCVLSSLSVKLFHDSTQVFPSNIVAVFVSQKFSGVILKPPTVEKECQNFN